MGYRLSRALKRHLRLRLMGRTHAHAPARTRPIRRQAALLRDDEWSERRQRTVVRLRPRDQSDPRVGSLQTRTQPRGAQSISHFLVDARPAHSLSRHTETSARAPASLARWRIAGARMVGRFIR